MVSMEVTTDVAPLTNWGSASGWHQSLKSILDRIHHPGVSSLWDKSDHLHGLSCSHRMLEAGWYKEHITLLEIHFLIFNLADAPAF